MVEEYEDLPLCSNTNEILATHYKFSLQCDLAEKIIFGEVLASLSPVPINDQVCRCQVISSYDKPFLLILDCKDIEILDVDEVIVDDAGKKLKFKVDTWSLKIWKDTSFCRFCFPPTIRVKYRTKPTGKSLLWVHDQDTKPCVFTYGAWINNRSLFPCQEPPNAMATWEARIKVEDSMTVLMSGDEFREIKLTDGFKEFHFSTNAVLPMSTLALAIGYWEAESIEVKNNAVKCRLLAPSSLMRETSLAFAQYVPKCIDAAEKYMGSYPFPRMDILIVPRGFGSLGMASPNIVFLSQSTLTPDGSMNVRLSHELAHSWFGLLIGAKDWTEEWLSEGFATFLEDIFHTTALNWDDSLASDYKELRCWIRSKTLRAEVENTADELQTLRPTRGEEIVARVDDLPVKLVKNGMNTEKGFLQVHYIKGYFLLKYLCKLVGEKAFMRFLRDYVAINKGKLVDSKEFLEYFFSVFPSDLGETFETLTKDWLDSPGIPKKLDEFIPSSDNSLFNNAVKEANQLRKIFKTYKKRKKHPLALISINSSIILQDQLLVIFEHLLDIEEPISSLAFKHLKDHYVISKKNPEVRHRWCELIIKHRVRSMYNDVQDFLENDLAMGIYLFAEMINSNLKTQKQLAQKCYLELRDEMEPNFYIEINKMLDNS